jgi:hypothetical protein
VTTLTRAKDGRRFNLSGPNGTLTYDPDDVALSADGNLPPRVVASRYATDCDVALNDWYDGGEDRLWACMEMLFHRAEP